MPPIPPFLREPETAIEGSKCSVNEATNPFVTKHPALRMGLTKHEMVIQPRNQIARVTRVCCFDVFF